MQRLSLKQWETIFNNLADINEEVEIVWLDSTNEYVLCYEEELYEDSFTSEKDAQERLTYIENELSRNKPDFSLIEKHLDAYCDKWGGYRWVAHAEFMHNDYRYVVISEYSPNGESNMYILHTNGLAVFNANGENVNDEPAQ